MIYQKEVKAIARLTKVVVIKVQIFVTKFSEIQITEKKINFSTAEGLKSQDGKESQIRSKFFIRGRENFIILRLERESRYECSSTEA